MSVPSCVATRIIRWPLQPVASGDCLRRLICVVVLASAAAASPVRAQVTASSEQPASAPTDPDTPQTPADESGGGNGASEAPQEYGATELGVRMTPALAQAISGRMTEQMKRRYELDDKQTAEIASAIQHNILKLAHENAAAGRDAIEMMMATMIAHDGQMPREAAMEFSTQMKALIPPLRQFFQESAIDAGKSMTLKQRLKFTGDMTGLMAGLAVFESRMNRWEQGHVEDGANPFFDPPRSDDDADAEGGDPNESPELRRARRRVDNMMQWQLNVEGEWEKYVRNAIVYYDFDESQQTAANGILDSARERAAAVKNEDWRAAVRANRIADQLSWSLDEKFNRGPLRYQIEQAYQALRKPLNDIEEDLKRRIETLPTSKQRQKARKAAEKILQEKGLERLPV